MPNMRVELIPEKGQHKKEIIQKLLQMCEVEKIKVGAKGIIRWDAQPQIDGRDGVWIAIWRYKIIKT